MKSKWYQKSISELYRELKTSEKGLIIEDAKTRNTLYGDNILPKKESISIIKIFIEQIINPIVLILLAVSILSYIVGETVDATAILFIILVDLIMGTVEEFKTNKSAESLQNIIHSKTTVIRDNKKIQIDASKLVVGDIISVEPGDKINADCRIIESKNLTINESVLTGESLNTEKNNKIIKRETTLSEQKNMLFAGTSVITGRGLAIVVEIAGNTEVGKIVSAVNENKEAPSPLTIRINKFTKQISILIVIVSIIIAIVLYQKGYSGQEILLSVIALGVSAMPEGLPLALTMALTIGSNKMLKKNVIVKKLNAVESLGSCTLIASDKTGTLTVNEQTAKKIVLPSNDTFDITGSGYNNLGTIQNQELKTYNEALEIIKNTAINNEATLENINGKWTSSGDSIDVAFLALKEKAKIDISNLKQIEITPYESEKKYSAVKYEEDGSTYITVKGGLETVLNFCSNMIVNGKKKPLNHELIEKQNNELASLGYRIIAVATIKKDMDIESLEGLSFQGLVAFIDPIRKDALASIKQCIKAGIKVVMITGDHPLTAYSIGKELHLVDKETQITTSEELDKYLEKGEEAFDEFIKDKIIFSRVTPIQKLKIVESYKRNGEFVAVTGDGVNDAPAIKAANIGISMGSGTDVAKETADMIIIDDKFSSIVAGVKEGRNAYDNIRKICYFLISCGLAEVIFFLFAIIKNLPVPLVAIQLLWVNIVTDGLQDMALSFEQSSKNIMKEKPRSPKESLFNKKMISEILLSGLYIGILVFTVYVFLLKQLKINVTEARAYILMLMVFIQNIHVLNVRSEEESTFEIPFFQNKILAITILTSIILQIIVSEVPLLSKYLQIQSVDFMHVLVIFITSLTVLLLMEVYKKICKQRR